MDDFEGPKLSHKWVATRYSQGGQNDGQWLREVKNSKLFWKGLNAGTEAGYWGEWLSLPVNALGDIIIDTDIRLKRISGVGNYIFGVGFNQTANLIPRYGVMQLYTGGAIYCHGRNNFSQTVFPAMSSKNQYGPVATNDCLLPARIVRKSNYAFLYIGGFYIGHFAYASTITSVDIVSMWQNGVFDSEMSMDVIRVTPASVVL